VVSSPHQLGVPPIRLEALRDRSLYWCAKTDAHPRDRAVPPRRESDVARL
jgi:hypothetical protein